MKALAVIVALDDLPCPTKGGSSKLSVSAVNSQILLALIHYLAGVLQSRGYAING